MKSVGIYLSVVGLAAAVCSCTTPTGTRVQLDPARLSQVKSVGIVVTSKEPFSVYLSRDRMSNTGAIIGGLIGAGIEAGMRSSDDQQVTQKLRPSLGGFDLRAELVKDLQRQLEASGLFTTVRPLESVSQGATKTADVDAILEVTVQQWGLVVCNANNSDHQLQAGITSHERLSTMAGNRTLWVQDEVHLDGDCHFSSDYETKPDFLRQALTRSADAFAGRTANEIKYPRATAARSPQ